MVSRLIRCMLNYLRNIMTNFDPKCSRITNTRQLTVYRNINYCSHKLSSQQTSTNTHYSFCWRRGKSCTKEKPFQSSQTQGSTLLKEELTTGNSKTYILVILPRPFVGLPASHVSHLQLPCWLFFKERTPYRSPPVDFSCNVDCAVASRWLESPVQESSHKQTLGSTLKNLV